MLQLAQRLRLDLTDTLAGNRELLANLFKRVVRVHANAEAHAQNAFFTRRQRRQNAGRRLAQVRLNGGVDRQQRILVFDEVAEMRILFVTHRGFERDRLLGDLQNLANLFQRHGQLLGQLFRGRLAADLVQHLARGTNDLVDRFDHVHRNTDRAGLVGNRAGDCLPDPPRRIGRELVTTTVFKLVHRLHQADIAFLNEIEELQAAVGVLLRNRDHETQVGLDHLLLGDARFAFALLHHRNDAAEFGDGDAGFRGEVLDFLADFPDCVAFFAREFFPATSGQIGDRLHPVRIEFRTVILLEEAVALDAVGFGKAQQTAFVLHQALGNVIELLDKAVDAVLVQRQRLHGRDQLILQFLVTALLTGRERARAGKTCLHLLILKLAQLLVGIGDGIERFHDLRAQFGFHRSKRKVGLVVVLFFLFRRQAVATHVRHILVAGRRAQLAGLFLLFGSLAVSLDFFRALELRRSLGFRAGIGRFEIDDLAQQRRAFVEFVAPDDQRLERQRAFAQARNHRFAAGLDALGDGDFAFARQKLHGTHFAQIHAHRVIGTVGRFFLLGGRKCGAAGGRKFATLGIVTFGIAVIVAGGGFFCVLVFDDVDAHFRQHGHDVFNPVRINLIGRKNFIQFVHGHIAALLGGLDHFFDCVIRKVEKRAIRRTVAFVFCFFVFFDFGCHLSRRFP
ncbi:RNA Polymerase Sigma Factor RpoS [Agrobacterium tumefaciens]|nr:RNA Polymerase Sigma Factor RpoS [Agrobacterium tumefaciens]